MKIIEISEITKNYDVKYLDDLPEFVRRLRLDDYPIVLNFAHLYYCIHCGKFLDSSIYTINYLSLGEMKNRLSVDSKKFLNMAIIASSLLVTIEEDYELCDKYSEHDPVRAIVISFDLHDEYETTVSRMFEEFYITLYDLFYSSLEQNKSQDLILLKLGRIIKKYLDNPSGNKSKQYSLNWLLETTQFRKLLIKIDDLLKRALAKEITYEVFFNRIEKTLPKHSHFDYRMDIGLAPIPIVRKDEEGEYFYNPTLGEKQPVANFTYNEEFGIYELLDYKSYFNKLFYYYRYDIMAKNKISGYEQIFLARDIESRKGYVELAIDSSALHNMMPGVPSFDKIKAKRKFERMKIKTGTIYSKDNLENYLIEEEKKYYSQYYNFTFEIEYLDRYLEQKDIDYDEVVEGANTKIKPVVIGDYEFHLVSIRPFLLFK